MAKELETARGDDEAMTGFKVTRAVMLAAAVSSRIFNAVAELLAAVITKNEFLMLENSRGKKRGSFRHTLLRSRIP